MIDFETTIGLEVHVQLHVRSKLFAPSPYDSGGEPNTRVSASSGLKNAGYQWFRKPSTASR